MWPASIPRWLPNAISCLRVALVPAWVVFAELAQRADALGERRSNQYTAAVILLVIGASDIVDGWLARRYSLQSHLGATIDAVADKLTQVVLTTYLALRFGPAFSAVPLWFLGMLIIRDALMIVSYLAIHSRHKVVQTEHEHHGKLASVFLFLVLVFYCVGLPDSWISPLLYFTAALVVISTALYGVRGWREFVKASDL